MFSFWNILDWYALNGVLLVIVLLMLERLNWEFEPDVSGRASSLVEWVKENPGYGLLTLGVAIIISALSEETRVLWAHDVVFSGYMPNKNIAPWTGESTRSLGLALGALAGVYGLVLAGRRLQVSQDQVYISQKQAETAESNLFNDRLKSGLTFLDNKSISIRCAGILLLQQYALNASVAASEKETISKVLVNFIRHRADTPVEGKRPDLELAISALTKTIPLEARFEGKEELRLNNLDLSGLDFQKLDLSFFNFTSSNMKLAKFSLSKLNKTRFLRANLENALFWIDDCVETTFENANMAGSYLFKLKLDEGSSLVDANLENSNIYGLSILGSDCRRADFSGADIVVKTRLTEEVLDAVIFEKGREPKIEFEEIGRASCRERV